MPPSLGEAAHRVAAGFRQTGHSPLRAGLIALLVVARLVLYSSPAPKASDLPGLTVAQLSATDVSLQKPDAPSGGGDRGHGCPARGLVSLSAQQTAG
jgi:hypothetical protein